MEAVAGNIVGKLVGVVVAARCVVAFVVAVALVHWVHWSHLRPCFVAWLLRNSLVLGGWLHSQPLLIRASC